MSKARRTPSGGLSLCWGHSYPPRVPRPALVAWLLVVLLLPAACADEGSAPPATSQPAAGPTLDAAAVGGATTPVAARPRRSEAPLPAYDGVTLEGEPLSLSELLGKRLLLMFFNPDVDSAAVMADAVARLAGAQGEHNFRIVGVAMSDEADEARRFLEKHGLTATSLHDPQARLLNRLRSGGAPTGLVLADGEGYVVQKAIGRFPTDGPDPVGLLEDLLREWLRVPEQAGAGGLLERPKAPDFDAVPLDGDETFRLSSLSGRPVILIFFLHTCPHCHEALKAIRATLDGLPEEQRPPIVGVSVRNQPTAVRGVLKDEGLDFFPVVFDPTEKVAEAYGTGMTVPVIYLLDEEHRIVSRTSGWREDRDPALLKMRLHRLAGSAVPMLLHSKGYSGDEFCGVCHETQHATWQLTNHASAFDTLVKHGASHDPECVGCHVVGWDQPAGYSLESPQPALEGVSCENCHGRGGPHLSPGFVEGHDYEKVCVTCHNPTHSLGFEYASFLPRVSHAANQRFARLRGAELEAFLAERRKPRTDLLPSQAAYVGSDACQGCHAAEHQTWSEQPHARAFATLEGKGKSGDAECLQCHTTALGKTGGFDLAASENPGLAAVGCESCHGPGGDHVPADAAKHGTILSLGDKCDSCVILKICGGCHDDANDPGFEFEVQDKIDRQRHGTIEPSSGEAASHAGPPEGRAPISSHAPPALPPTAAIGLLERAAGDAS